MEYLRNDRPNASFKFVAAECCRLPATCARTAGGSLGESTE
jgi:hypothetical protein